MYLTDILAEAEKFKAPIFFDLVKVYVKFLFTATDEASEGGAKTLTLQGYMRYYPFYSEGQNAVLEGLATDDTDPITKITIDNFVDTDPGLAAQFPTGWAVDFNVVNSTDGFTLQFNQFTDADSSQPALTGALAFPGSGTLSFVDVSADGFLRLVDLVAFQSSYLIDFISLKLVWKPAPSPGSINWNLTEGEDIELPIAAGHPIHEIIEMIAGITKLSTSENEVELNHAIGHLEVVKKKLSKKTDAIITERREKFKLTV